MDNRNRKETCMKYKLLKKYFGYDTFREGQEFIIDALVSGQDALGIMPTSGGKSLCYQLPSLLKEGMTIVVSPLIALMKDQVDGLNEMGIGATFINSTLSASENRERWQNIGEGKYKLIYVAPERLLTFGFIDLCKSVNISLVAVDEAHCISQWGHDFRPSYGDIPRFIESLDSRPVVGAFTATATTRVVDEIKVLLNLKTPKEVIIGFDRPNLFYKVIKPKDKLKYLKDYMDENHTSGSGVIYCSTRKTVESLTSKLQGKGYNVKGYHGGMSTEERTQTQEDFMMDRVNLMVATNAFGMGIDKPDIRYVVHYNMPKNMESYYQEAGRAGRDGGESECILMYSPSDIVKQKFIISQNEMTPTREKIQLENLQYLVNYCHSDDCLRSEILAYFGEAHEQSNCGKCGNCTEEIHYVDITIDAQKIMSCIYRTRQRFGINLIINTLRGSKNKRIKELGLDQATTYGLLAEYSEGALREIIMNLIARGYLELTADQYPVLKLCEKSKEVLFEQGQVTMRQERTVIKDNKKKKSRKSKTSNKMDNPYDAGLYDQLAELRSKLAEEKQVPRFMILSNATLEDIAYYKPVTEEAFLEVKGIGESKMTNYGDAFMAVVRSYMEGALQPKETI